MWATHITLEHNGKFQVITAASNTIRSYDLNGRLIIWQCNGLTSNLIPSPVVKGEVIYCLSGYKDYALLLSATGDI